MTLLDKAPRSDIVRLSFVVSRHSLLMLELRRFLSLIWMTSYTESSFKIVSSNVSTEEFVLSSLKP